MKKRRKDEAESEYRCKQEEVKDEDEDEEKRRVKGRNEKKHLLLNCNLKYCLGHMGSCLLRTSTFVHILERTDCDHP